LEGRSSSSDVDDTCLLTHSRPSDALRHCRHLLGAIPAGAQIARFGSESLRAAIAVADEGSAIPEFFDLGKNEEGGG
jgi:hypothetical protein